MKIGLGLYRHMLTPDNFRFAKQAGATHIVAHWVDYWGKEEIPSTDGVKNWGISDNRGKLWTYEELRDLKKAVNAEGLELAAIENLDPSHWYDILLDGPEKPKQLEDVKTIIRRLGKAGHPYPRLQLQPGGRLGGTYVALTRAAGRSPWDFWARKARKKPPSPTARPGT
jgi:mannonate dehydratase